MLQPAELQFDAPSHTYRLGGRVLPSVTQVLEPLQFLDGIPWAVLEAARKFGDHVHQAVHLWNVERLDEDALDPHLVPYLQGWKAFLLQTGGVVIHSELRVVNRKLGYAGTLDSAVRFPTLKKHVVDVKSGIVPKTVGPQTAAYRDAFLEERDEDLSRTRFCVQLTGDGRFKLHKLNDPTDFNLFVSALNVHKWRARHA